MTKLVIKTPSEIYNPTPARELRDEALALVNYASGISDALQIFEGNKPTKKEKELRAALLAIDKAKQTSSNYNELISQAIYTATTNDEYEAESILQTAEEFLKVEDKMPKGAFTFASFA